MAGNRFQVKGLRELGAAMRGLSADMAGKVAQSATGAGAGVVRKAAKANAPIAEAPYTVRSGKGDEGVLVQPANIPKNIITKRVRTSALTSEHVVTVRGKRKDGYANRIGILQEFGTVNAPAQPFLGPALESNVQAATDAMAKRLKARIEKVRPK